MLGVASNGGGRKGASLMELSTNMGLGGWGSLSQEFCFLFAKWFILMVTGFGVLKNINLSPSLMMLGNYIWLLPPVLCRIRLVKKRAGKAKCQQVTQDTRVFLSQIGEVCVSILGLTWQLYSIMSPGTPNPSSPWFHSPKA